MAADKPNVFGLEFDTSAINAALDKLQADAGEHVRAAAQAGAQVLYEEARLRSPVSKHAHWFYGTHQKYFFTPGSLRNAIYQVYSEDNSQPGVKATYHISWNHQKVPYGFMVEYGTSRAPAHPFIRPAFDSAKSESLQAASNEFTTRMTKTLQGLKT
jgi:HK97 gp10 family phage protein